MQLAFVAVSLSSQKRPVNPPLSLFLTDNNLVQKFSKSELNFSGSKTVKLVQLVTICKPRLLHRGLRFQFSRSRWDPLGQMENAGVGILPKSLNRNRTLKIRQIATSILLCWLDWKVVLTAYRLEIGAIQWQE